LVLVQLQIEDKLSETVTKICRFYTMLLLSGYSYL